jgi:hypothetical protein
LQIVQPLARRLQRWILDCSVWKWIRRTLLHPRQDRVQVLNDRSTRF